MQRKFLEDLGLEKETVDKIMAENGNDIESTKQKLNLEVDKYKGQLATAQDALKDFEGVDVKDLQGKIDKLFEIYKLAIENSGEYQNLSEYCPLRQKLGAALNALSEFDENVENSLIYRKYA